MSDTKTVSGSIVHIQDKGAPTALSVIVNINPRQSGSGTPSPSNVRPISGWESVNVTDAGKNLFDKADTDKQLAAYFNGTTITRTTGRKVVWVVCSPNTTYTVSRKRLTTSERLYAAYSEDTPAYGTTISGVTIAPASGTVGDNISVTITTNATAKYLVIWAYWDGFSEALDELQIEFGSTATAYAPYNGHTTTTPLGRTVYGGEAEIVGGSLTDKMGIVDLGTLTWTYQTSTGLFYSNGFPACKNNTNKLIFSNREWTPKPNQNEVRATDETICKDSDGRFYVHDSSYNTTADFQSAMSGSMMCYELATPQTYTLTGQNVTLLKDCYAWADSGDISITYETYLINGLFHKIWINGVKMFAPNDFTLERSDVYAGEITTCTGKTIADRIGWKYADMSLNWDYLPQEYLETILNLSGVFTITFENEEGVQFTEQCIRKGSTMTGTRFTDNDGNMMWKGVQFDISFINVHN